MTKAKAGYGAVNVLLGQMEKTGLGSIAVLALHVGLAATCAISRIAHRWRVKRAYGVAVAHLAADYAQIVVVGRASVTLFADHTRAAFAFASRVTLQTFGTKVIALAVNAGVFVFAPIKA